MRWTILQPTIFTEVWAGIVTGIPLQAGAPVTLVGDANDRHAHISEADMAAFTVAAVQNPLAETLVSRSARRPTHGAR